MDKREKIQAVFVLLIMVFIIEIPQIITYINPGLVIRDKKIEELEKSIDELEKYVKEKERQKALKQWEARTGNENVNDLNQNTHNKNP